jgi:hypothetical protein
MERTELMLGEGTIRFTADVSHDISQTAMSGECPMTEYCGWGSP